MFCKQCGKNIPDGVNFCPFCGGRQIDLPPADKKPQAAAVNEPSTQKEVEPQPVVKKKKRLWPRFVIAGVAVAGIVTFAVIKGGQISKERKEEKFRTEMRHAKRYLNDLDYEQAIVAYEAAIKIDPKNPKPYIGIADTYIAMGDYDSAEEYLDDGYDRTKDRQIRDYLKEVEAALKSRTDISGMVMTEGVDLDMYDTPVAGASVHLDKIAGSRYKTDTKTDSDGMYKFEDLRPGKYKLTITADNYIDVEQVIDIYPGQEESYSPVIMMISKDMYGEGTASGRIIDAVTGDGVGELTLSIREGYNSTQGQIISETETDYSGYYTTSPLKAGYYTIEITDQRKDVEEPFIRSYITVRILGNRSIAEQNGAVSTKLVEGQVRIVLSWGATPLDLDSHLFCFYESGESHMNYYGNSRYYDGATGERIVDLDLDDTDSYGPETTTIYEKRDGDYTFGIYDYSHSSEADLKNSHAIVQVYLGNSVTPTYVFYVPQLDGYYWEVFKYDGKRDRITPVNQMFRSYMEREYYSSEMGY